MTGYSARTRRSVLLGVSLSALAVPQVAFSQSCAPDPVSGLCEVVVTTPDQTVTVAAPTRIINNATSTSVVQASPPSFLVIDNRSGASLDQISLVAPGILITAPGVIRTPRTGAILLNAGTVNGDVLMAGGTYIAAGGTVTGSVMAANLNAFLSEVFIDRSGGLTSVTGGIDPGAGIDSYIKSYDASGTAEVPATLPTHFEVAGIEVLGKGTMISVVNPDGVSASNGLALLGEGSVVNRAVLNDFSFTGSGLSPAIIATIPKRAVNYAGLGNLIYVRFTGAALVNSFAATTGSALTLFANEGTINGDIGVNAASFVNSGTINLRSNQSGTYIQGAKDEGLSFINSGHITMVDNGRRATGQLLGAAITMTTALDGTSGTPLSFLNDSDAQIMGGVVIGGQATTLRFENRGDIIGDNNPNNSGDAVGISWSDFGELAIGIPDFVADSVVLINSGTVDGFFNADGAAKSVSFDNSGTITNDVEIGLYAGPDAAGNSGLVDAQNFSFRNSGSILSTVGLELEATTADIANTGDISVQATSGLTIYPAAREGLRVEQETVLGSMLSFSNSGTIESADFGGAAVLIGVEAGDVSSGVSGAATASASVSVTNSGTLRATGGAFVTPGQFFGLAPQAVVVIVPVALGIGVDAEGVGSLSINNTTDGLIEGVPSTLLVGNPNGAFPTTNPSSPAGIVTFADTVSINNDGLIRAGGVGSVLPTNVTSGQTRIAYPGYGMVDIALFEGVGGGAIDTFVSADTITNGVTGTITGGIALRQGNDLLTNLGTITGNVFMGTGNDRVTNAGTIAGNVSLGDGNDIYVTFLKDYTAHNTGTIDGGIAGGDTLILLANNGGSLQDYVAAPRTNFEFVALGGAGTVTSSGDTLLPVVQLTGNVTLAEGSVVNAGQAFAFRSDTSIPVDSTFTNRGTINGSISLHTGNDVFANYGTLNGSLDLGDGDDSFLQGINAVLTGTADGGQGRDTFTLDINGGGRISSTLYDQLVNFEVLGLTGSGAIISDTPLPVETIELSGDGGAVSFGEDAVIETQGDTAITGSDAGDDLSNAGTINGNVDLGSGDNQFANYGTTNGDVASGAGSDSLDNGGTINGDVATGDGADDVGNSGDVAGSIDTGEGDDGLNNSGSIGGNVDTGVGDDGLDNAGLIGGDVDAGDGNDTLNNSGSIGGDVNLDGTSVQVEEQAPEARSAGLRLAAVAEVVVPVSGANDTFTSSGSIAGSVFAGAGNDSFTLSGEVGGSVSMGNDDDTFMLSGQVGGAVDMGDGNDTLTSSGIIAGNALGGFGNDSFSLSGQVGGNVDAGDDDDTLIIADSGTIQGDALGGSGIDSFTLSGAVGGGVDLGDGNDVLVLQGAWSVGGTAAGGSGSDALHLGSTGTEASPRELDLARFQSFEQLSVQSGVNAVTGSATFASIEVVSGRLIGRAGSVLGGNVSVAQGATFGTAGTVNGAITVNGTLSPGASPATMTVNGNVSLASTSNTAFEFTPGVSDALIINGALSIASGAKLTMTGNRPITPGTYTMVSASQAITGSFGANITRDAAILGVLRQTSNTIELIGLFQLQASANQQAVLTKDYLNALLVGGQATAGVIDAFPALIGADGFARTAQLATLNPEPYADAAQMGLENGLSIARALRGVTITGRSEDSGLFVFGQGYGSWRDFDGDERGVSAADVNSYGFLGGLGYGNDTFNASLFVGRSDTRQRISAIGARNGADGLFFGGRMHLSLDAFTAGASIVFDRAEGDTARAPAVGGAALGHYKLHGTTADAWVGYGAILGGGWKIGPEVGVTLASTHRSAVSETGGGAFALNVRKQNYDAVFLTGGLKLESPKTSTFRPWLAGGVRHRASGSAIIATGALTGTTTSFTVAGVERDRTVPYVGAGLAVDLGTNASLFLNGDAEFSRNNALRNVNAGVTFRF